MVFPPMVFDTNHSFHFDSSRYWDFFPFSFSIFKNRLFCLFLSIYLIFFGFSEVYSLLDIQNVMNRKSSWVLCTAVRIGSNKPISNQSLFSNRKKFFFSLNFGKNDRNLSKFQSFSKKFEKVFELNRNSHIPGFMCPWPL
jgi:hypothetical protein